MSLCLTFSLCLCRSVLISLSPLLSASLSLCLCTSSLFLLILSVSPILTTKCNRSHKLAVACVKRHMKHCNRLNHLSKYIPLLYRHNLQRKMMKGWLKFMGIKMNYETPGPNPPSVWLSPLPCLTVFVWLSGCLRLADWLSLSACLLCLV